MTPEIRKVMVHVEIKGRGKVNQITPAKRLVASDGGSGDTKAEKILGKKSRNDNI